MIDFRSRIDVTSKMSPRQARKVLAEIFNVNPNFVSFSKHGLAQMKKRNLKTTDVLNVLRAGQIKSDPEFEKGTYRYRLETNNILVVIAFRKPNHVVVVTAWRK